MSLKKYSKSFALSSLKQVEYGVNACLILKPEAYFLSVYVKGTIQVMRRAGMVQDSTRMKNMR